LLCCLNFIFLYCFARIVVAGGKVEKVLSIRSYIGVENLNKRTCALESKDLNCFDQPRGN
jgi:hypothetical protein